jgi:hypothetical protein
MTAEIVSIWRALGEEPRYYNSRTSGPSSQAGMSSLLFWRGRLRGRRVNPRPLHGGCQVRSLIPVQVGMTLRLSLFIRDQVWPVRIGGAVVRWVKGNSFGLEFTEIRSAPRERIRWLLMHTKLEGSPHASPL